MSITPNLEDRERDKFLESPSRPGFTAVETVTTVIGGDIIPKDDGIPFYYDVVSETDPGIEKVVISYSAASNQRLTRLEGSCRMESVVSLVVNGAVVASKRTGAASPNFSFSFDPKRAVSIGHNVQVKIKARAGSPVVNCEFYLMGLSI
jgi:hypothetical protein